MKTKIKNLSKVLLVAITIFSIFMITSCSKDGQNGKDGVPGTVNVYYSPWASRTFTGSGISWQTDYEAPQITQEILDKGTVLCYLKQDAYVAPIPFYYPQRIEVYYEINRIIHYASFNPPFQFRYIVIPGGTSNLAGRNANNITTNPIDYSKMSYHQICVKFNIPE
jgi:hypothetical protein